MNRPPHHDREGPTPVQIAAYADGELGPADRAAVEAWLCDHPDARAEVEGHRGLGALCRDAAPPVPDEAAWAGVLARVEADLARGRLAGRGKWLRRTAALWVAVGCAAAALLLALLPGRPPANRPPTAPPALPVVSSDDVDIISMDGRDRDFLVVGDPPVRGPLTLASAQDVTVDSTGRDVEVVLPEGNGPGPAAPMLVPVAPAAGSTP